MKTADQIRVEGEDRGHQMYYDVRTTRCNRGEANDVDAAVAVPNIMRCSNECLIVCLVPLAACLCERERAHIFFFSVRIKIRKLNINE